jgi:hypothetical protein
MRTPAFALTPGMLAHPAAAAALVPVAEGALSLDTLYFRGERTGRVQAIPAATLRRVEVSLGRRSVVGPDEGIGASSAPRTAVGFSLLR